MKPDLQMIDAGAVRLRVAIQGTGPLIVLIHGFPESWYSWRHQITALANAGYRVAAPDVRGYGRQRQAGRDRGVFDQGRVRGHRRIDRRARR